MRVIPDKNPIVAPRRLGQLKQDGVQILWTKLAPSPGFAGHLRKPLGHRTSPLLQNRRALYRPTRPLTMHIVASTRVAQDRRDFMVKNRQTAYFSQVLM